MKLNKKQLLDLPVETKSGTELGVVVDFELDGGQHNIIGYIVKKSSLISRMVTQELVIRPKQIIAITDKKMTVEDLVIEQGELETAAEAGLN